MVSIKTKTIKGRKYKYASKSLRLPDGRVATVEKRLNGASDIESSMARREEDIMAKYAAENYRLDGIFTEETMRKMEIMAIEYKRMLKKLSRKQLQDLFDRFTMNFTYESNALEGNSLTLKDVAIIIEEEMVPKNKDLREIYETRNSREVVDMILKKRFKISERDIIRMHSMLVTSMGISTGYKTVPNYIVGSDLETAPPERVGDEMRNLVAWINENPESLHPLQLSARAHGKFEKIHPFEDGNGRVGRFLSNLILIRNDYSPLIIRKTQRLSYLKALQNFDSKYYPTLDRFFLGRHKETFRKFFEVYLKYI